ncbi:unnamed protein product [Effrenium voratum]|uniref:Copper transport protein n=1 Tax=Effrenium voratum TaxID=2562239 RepID=A0AA36NIG0_9DINO|nr:unnamed protein product [Effrenium voratum]CAJ1403523.1 unnamed protein product [Effrenium voratum]
MSEEVFCKGEGSVMSNGFQIAIGPSQYCALFLFPGWGLDSPAKYLLGCCGACAIPMAIVSVQLVRERVVEISQRGGGIAPDALAAVLFGLQMTLAYFVMLLVMLYETVIFSCVIAGFMIATFLLQRFKRRKAASSALTARINAAPCCSPDMVSA